MSGEREALAKIFALAQAQVRALHDGRRRSDVDAGGLAQVSLELLLEGIAAEAQQQAAQGPTVALGVEAAALFEAHQALARESVNAQHHLSELAEGWGCPACGNTQPGAAKLSGAVSAPTLQLCCKRCGQSSPATAAGEAALRETFGHLFAPGWDPQRNGFV
ncbi:MAG: hypothetical protein IPJ65_12010 [Archangiaceae bacterium]|nr:hypothetical protein [Archangiaceae bacterium]